MTLILKRVQLLKDKPRREAIDRFLRQHQLSLEADCEMAIIAEYQQRLVGCGAIAGNVLKCIAIDPSLQGEGLSLKLLTELLTLAYELGAANCFCSLNLCNAALFSGAGFWPIAQAGDRAVLMENSRERLTRYCRPAGDVPSAGKKNRRYRDEC
ncbi:[citrate (pro-3S)-lyase] ligase [Klebsiella pneumoniae]|uniref:[citrate (Pro-3S)-lyase] ligase n=1 Tax=Klebsiella pneumoniae TaxID=573 RepID=A0A377TKD2_KLEPN|nr:[citrate (pro-3S)-lyase] ligase [Klebsiella pneumoniae]